MKIFKEYIKNLNESKKQSTGYIRFAGKKLKVKIVKLTKEGAKVIVDEPGSKLNGKELTINDSDLI